MIENNLSYEERLKERSRLISKIDEIQKKVDCCEKKIKGIKSEIGLYKNKIKKLEVEKQKIKREKWDFTKTINELREEYIKVGIAVPENGGYEIENGLSGMKRDINLKLTKFLDDNQIKQVFVYCCFFFIYFFLKVIWNMFRIFCLEKPSIFQIGQIYWFLLFFFNYNNFFSFKRKCSY
jgi:hypothetical protein